MSQNYQILSWALHHPELKSPDHIDYKKLIGLFLDFEKKQNLTPTHIGLSGDGYTSNKIVSYEKGYQKLTENDFQHLTSVSIYTNTPKSEDFAFYWETLFNISCSNVLGTHVYFGIKTSYNTSEILKEIIEPITLLLNPVLGYQFTSTPEDGPFAYSKGRVHTPQNDHLTEDHKELILDWFRDQDLITAGKLRDVYPAMILSKKHLEYPIEGKPLKEWIESDKKNGTLHVLSEQNTLWQIPSNNYTAIRDTLSQSDILIAYNKHLVPTSTT